MKKRGAFTMLLNGLESGWQVPDEAIREGCDSAAQLLRDSNVGARDRIRAAELLALVHERQHTRLLAIAKLESEVEGSGERFQIDWASLDNECDTPPRLPVTHS